MRSPQRSFLIVIFLGVSAPAQISRVWVADNGDGTYKNQIIHADYSDVDIDWFRFEPLTL